MANQADEAAERNRLLAYYLDDFERFCGALIWIVGKDGQRKKLRFNTIQRKYCESRTPRDVLVKSRQVGMTTLELARDVWKFVSEPGQRVIVLCQSMTDHQILNKLSGDIKRMLDGLRYFGVDLPFETESRTAWTLPDRDSTLTLVEAGASEAAAQKKGRGGTFTRVHATEVATWEYPEATLQALLEAVPKRRGTEVVFESTPKGVGNFFHTRFVGAQAGTNGYGAQFFPWFLDEDCWIDLEPGEVIEPQSAREREYVDANQLPPERIKFFRSKLAELGGDLDKFDEEYPSDPVRCFLTSGRLYFDLAALDVIAAKIKPPLKDVDDLRRPAQPTENATFVIPPEDLRVFERPVLGERYVISSDPAEGLGEDGDDTSSGVYHHKTRRHVATLRNKLDSNAHADQLIQVARHYNDALVAVERNKGLALIRALERLGYRNIYYDQFDRKPGIVTTAVSKPVMLEELADAVRDGSFHTDDVVLQTEMRAFVRDPRTGKPYAPGKGKKNGVSDDGIMMAMIGWRAMLVPPAPKVNAPTGGARTPIGDW
jgi:hypothetical protein